MSKFIAGPWRVFEHSWSDTSVLADGFDHAICCLDINHATEESQGADAAIMAANARLIASAPTLLAALLNLITAADHTEYGTAIHEARAAIRSATGVVAGVAS